MILMAEQLQNAGKESFPFLLEMKNVTIVRGGKKILDSVSLSINPGVSSLNCMGKKISYIC
jgi:iron complex transport system ATP-binding protein